jgi:hypothetical protein
LPQARALFPHHFGQARTPFLNRESWKRFAAPVAVTAQVRRRSNNSAVLLRRSRKIEFSFLKSNLSGAGRPTAHFSCGRQTN